MRWPRLWLMLGCLVFWGSGTALAPNEPPAGSKTCAQTSHGVSTMHGNVATIDDAEADVGEWLNERLRLQRDSHVAPHWRHASVPPSNWLRGRVALPTTRRAMAPPLVGTVELLI